MGYTFEKASWVSEFFLKISKFPQKPKNKVIFRYTSICVPYGKKNFFILYFKMKSCQKFIGEERIQLTHSVNQRMSLSWTINFLQYCFILAAHLKWQGVNKKFLFRAAFFYFCIRECFYHISSILRLSSSEPFNISEIGVLKFMRYLN